MLVALMMKLLLPTASEADFAWCSASKNAWHDRRPTSSRQRHALLCEGSGNAHAPVLARHERRACIGCIWRVWRPNAVSIKVITAFDVETGLPVFLYCLRMQRVLNLASSLMCPV